MSELVATTPGLYPLPDWAKEELADLKGHQKDDLIDGDEDEAVVAAYDRARGEVVDHQHEAGLDRTVEGQLRWDDLLAHPLTVHDAVETGGIVRYYDNNNFYRDPRVVDDLTFSGDVAADLDATADLTDDLQAVLPGPYSLADLATDEHYGDEADFLAAVADFLAGEVGAFPDHETLFLLEPSLVENPPGDGLDARASAAVDDVAAATDADVVVHTYWGAMDDKVYAHLMDADVAAIGVDLVAGDRDETVSNLAEYGTKDAVALGLVDGQNTRVEAPATVRERVDWLRGQVPGTFDTVYATSNTELFYLPVNRYREKLAALGAATAPEVEA
ncbi:MAG: 5-methyltetrahydropteroyltriglutamate--homocysteine methyltransferase [Haloferacaceae archaeon]